MTPEQRLENFYTALQKSNTIWWDLIKVKFGKKDLPDIAQKLLIELYAEGFDGKNIDWKQVQNRYAKMLTWATDKAEPVPQQKAEPVVIHPEALTGEARQAKLNEFLAAVQAAPILKPQRKLTTEQMAEEGGVRPKSTLFKRSAVETILAAKEAVKDAQNARRKLFLEAFPDAEQEEIEAYIRQWKSTDDPDGLIN
jgi:endo-alpha-1,4-polygalactosaminidase (GH114 family)